MGPLHVLILVLGTACAPDPGELPVSCDPRELAAGEVRVKRVACEDELVPGGEGRVGDWLIENAMARFIVRDVYASLTQIGEPGGTLVDAALVGGDDLLMELLPPDDPPRTGVTAVQLDGAAELQLPGFAWRLAADEPRLTIEYADESPGLATWVPRPGVPHTGAIARSGAAFFALDSDGPDASGNEELGQLTGVPLTGVSLTPEAHWPDGDALDAAVDADFVEVVVEGEVVDRVPVLGGVATSRVPAGGSVGGARDGCVYGGLELIACGGLTVRVQDEAGVPLSAAVRFGGAELVLPAGGGRAPLGMEAGEVWVWAGPGYSAWKGWFSGGEEEAAITLTRELPAEVEWPEGAGPGAPADWASGGALLADFGVFVAPDAASGVYAESARASERAAGVGLVLFLATDEVPSVPADPRDTLLELVGSSTGSAWAWGFSPTTRRAGHGALDVQDEADVLTLVRGGAAANRFVFVNATWAEPALAEPTWRWAELPDALWLDGPEDLELLEAFAAAWVDVQPVSARTWLPYVGAPNLPAVERALTDHTASAGNGPRVDVALSHPLGAGSPSLHVQVYTVGWMGAPTATLHTERGTRTVPLDASGAADLVLHGARWAFVEVGTPHSAPWGGEPGWAVSGLRWVGAPGAISPVGR